MSLVVSEWKLTVRSAVSGLSCFLVDLWISAEQQRLSSESSCLCLQPRRPAVSSARGHQPR